MPGRIGAGFVLLMIMALGCIKSFTTNASPPPQVATVEQGATPAGQIVAEIQESSWEVHQPETPIAERIARLEAADKAIYRRLDNDEHCIAKNEAALRALKTQADETADTVSESETLLTVHELAIRSLMEGTKNTSSSLVDVSKAVAELAEHQNETTDVLSKLVTDQVPQKQLSQALNATAPNPQPVTVAAPTPQTRADKFIEIVTGESCLPCKEFLLSIDRSMIEADGYIIVEIDQFDPRAAGVPGTSVPRFRVVNGQYQARHTGPMPYRRFKEIEQAVLNRARR